MTAIAAWATWSRPWWVTAMFSERVAIHFEGEAGDIPEDAPDAPARPAAAPAASGGTLASDEALQALREKLSGGGGA